MTGYTQEVDITTRSRLAMKKTIAASWAERWLMHPAHIPTWNVLRTLTQAMTCAPSQALQWKWGRTILQALSLHLADAEKTTYHVTDVDVVRLAQTLTRTYPVALTQALTAHQATTLALGLVILQRLKLTPAHTPHTTFHAALAQAILTTPALARFLGITLSQNLTAHAALARTYVASPALVQALTIHPGLANKLLIQITSTIDISPRHIPQMIYSGDPLLDTISMTGLYISPTGDTTTWAINTRTNAITEYTNYNFNSFAPMGLRYIAANATGIYELDGDTDAGVSIIAEVQSGLMHLNGTKLTGLKGVYLAIRGGGRVYIKIISGDGREYIYEAVAQPGLMTTKIDVGKGLRTSYIAFNLQTEGQDFDLDTLEFVPMLSDRRVG